METQERGPASGQTPSPTLTPAATSPPSLGAWPPTPVSDQLREQWLRERARHELVMDSLRAHLAEQPSPDAIRACARRWCSDITHLADDVIAALNSTENE